MTAALFGKGIPIKSRSRVWKYFTISPEDTSIAICNTCKLKVSREIASKELKLNEEENKRKAESEKNVLKKIKSTEASCLKQSQQTLFETLARKKPWDINDHRSKLINNYIAEIIAVDIQPFSIVEDIGFQRLLNHICPNYLTAHWLTNEFHQKSAVLRVCQFNVSHTAKNICEAIQSSMNDFFIPASKVHLVARDNSANMAAGIREAGYNSLPCFLHTLQLVLNDTVFAQIYIKNISTTCKNIVTHFNHSPSSFEAYRKYQTQYQVPQNRFKQDIATRWNSQYFMFKRIFEQKRALIPFCCDNDNSKLKSLENNEWIILEKLQRFLKMFNDITNLLSKCEAIASAMIPTVQVIQTMLIQAEKFPLFFGLGTILKEYCSKSFQQNDQIEFQPEVSSSSSTTNLDFDFSKCFENFIKNKNTLIENTSISEVLQETESKHYIKLKNEVFNVFESRHNHATR
ncbi:zinc finger BED domain-containing protein 4-like [Hydra vulgaris]|uniref:zinc finger BED domain-containing protein 4-like n=1 Tax=Hydra vulgaris TaxID=6087 RepID=UPI0032EA6F4F